MIPIYRPDFMRLIGLAMIVSIFLEGRAVAQPASKDEYQKKLDRRVNVHPVVQSTGVVSGLIIAFGHVIPAPYRFRYANSKLSANGVQLVPSPIAEKENEAVRAMVTVDRTKLLDELGLIEKDARTMYAERRSHNEILQFVKSKSGVIADAKWKGEKVLLFRLMGDKFFTHFLEFTGLTQETRKQANATSDPSAQGQGLIQQYQRDLAGGACLFFSSDNGVMKMEDPRKRVLEIMSNQALSSDDRLRVLTDIFPGNRIAAYDVMTNFVASEWQDKGRKGKTK